MTASKDRPTWQEIAAAEQLITQATLEAKGIVRTRGAATDQRCGVCNTPRPNLQPYKRAHIDSAGVCEDCRVMVEESLDRFEGLTARDEADWSVFETARRAQHRTG